MDKRLRVGIIGAGAISGRYIGTIRKRFPLLEVVSVCAAHRDRAEKKAREYGIAASTLEEMLADPSIDMVLNLTPVGAHYEIIKKALLAGKHVYTEKTMTDDPRTAEEARTGRKARTDAELAVHVLDVLHAMLESGETGSFAAVKSSCERPEPLTGAVELS